MLKNLINNRIIGLIIIFFLLSIVFSSNCLADDYSDASKYAPIYYFEKEESLFPVDVNYHIDNSYLYLINSETPQLQTVIPSNLNRQYLENLNNLNTGDLENLYLDNIKGTVDNEKVISDYKNRDTSKYPNTVYYRVEDIQGNKVIQYWTFYAFNKGDLNKHEGDWEMVQVVIPTDGEKWASYSQHMTGQRASWDLVEKDGDNIKVYVARGSHANYYRSYSGKLGIASDHCGDNGVIWKQGDYKLVDINDPANKDWIDFPGRWGEVPSDVDEAITDAIFGQIGPEGPQYIQNGDMWNDPMGWGQSLGAASALFFLLEWFFANFVLIFIIITIITILIMLFFIYRKHKKYGLGPRIVSMLYIDGLNLKSIGNILCFIAIIIAILGLFYPWYGVSYSVKGVNVPEDLVTEGTVDAINIDGLNGIQIIVPGLTGSQPVGAVIIPFSLIIGIGFVLLILASVGLFMSRKLGYKYVKRGIAVLSPVIMIIIIFMLIGSFIPKDIGGTTESGESMSDVVKSITSSPLGGEKSVEVTESNITGKVDFSWGLRLGGQLLLFGGIIFIIAGMFEIFANTMFFEPKNLPEKHKKKGWYKKGKKQITGKQNKQGQQLQQQPPMQQQPMPPLQPQQQSPPQKSDKKPPAAETGFCTECGKKLKKGSEFCTKCGKKVE